MAFLLGLVALAAAILLVRSSGQNGAAARHDMPQASVLRRQPSMEDPATIALPLNPGMMRHSLGAHQALARSLEGTEVDGTLAADEHGNLILVLGVRDFFDYFLSTVGEIPLERAVAFMEAYARERLPEKAADQLMALLADYMAYREAAARVYQQPLVPIAEQTQTYYLETLDKTFRDLEELRRAHMSEGAVRAFFSLEEEYGRYTLDRMAIQMDTQLDAEDKSLLLAELRAQLESETLRRSEEQNVARTEQAREIETILESDMDSEQRRVALSRYHTPDHVERIINHLELKSDFSARMDEYLAQRARLMNLSEEQREPLLAELRQRYFHSAQELIWARTYEARGE